MKKLILLFSALLLTTQLLAQQSWQWGKRGGGGTKDNGYLSEGVVDMAIDPAGNVYTISNILFDQNDVDVDGKPLTGRYTDVVVSSFSCAGKLRWTKVLGNPSIDVATALKVDALGGVYIMCALYGTNSGESVKIDSDTTLGDSYRTIFIIKYDTAGNYKWLQRPEPDTTSVAVLNKGNGVLDMEVDKAGNSYAMCYLSKGLYGTGSNAYTVATPGVHMLRYNKEGAFLGGNTMAITVDAYNSPVTKWWLTRTPSGKFIVNGSPSFSGTPLSFGNTVIDRPAFVGSFNSNGTLNWVKQSTLTYASGIANTRFTKASVDSKGSIYMAGIGTPGDNFGGIAFANPIGYVPGVYSPIAFRIDSNGNTLWGKNAYNIGESDGQAGALTTSGEYVVGGVWSGTMYWPGHAADSIRHPANWFQSVFITRFNAQTGAFIKTDTLASPPGDNQQVTAMAADKAGNVYIGGSFQSSLKVAGTTLTAKPGGYFDFFVAKYGTSNCKPVGIENVTLPAESNTIAVVPNPATSSTRIDYKLVSGTKAASLSGTKAASLELYDLMGRRVASQQLTEQVGNWTVDLMSLPAGTYLVILRQNGGGILQTKLVVTH